MRTKIIILSLFFVFTSSWSLFAQPGKDGARTITAANQVLNEYTTLTADAGAGASTLQVASSSLNANGRFAAGLSAGDLILIIQVQGATIVGGSWWYDFGSVSSYNNCGNNELAQVASVPSGTTITLNCPLTRSYTSSGKVQVIRVPRLSGLTVNSGGSITCDAWNGSIGGVVALEVSGVTTINSGGTIHANGKGFRGGLELDGVDNLGATMYASTNNGDGAEKGEGIAGWGAEYDLAGGRYCKNAAANGGGGGNAHNGGGGGGANGSSIYLWNGKGNPDTSTASWKAAWDLESANFHKNQSDGGGRGGYTFSASNLDATLVAPGNTSWGGDYRRNEGGQGGHPLDYNFDRLYLGGGGGAGDQGPDTDWGGEGGNGGGLVYIRTFNVINGAGIISSDGDPGINSQGSAPFNDHAGIDGAGGGGAGGTLFIESAGNIANTITLRVNGGKGGDQNKTRLIEPANGEAEGPGGGGGGGVIRFSYGAPVCLASGGANGTSYAQTTADCGVTEFPPNGATKGGTGTTNLPVSTYTFTVKNDTICSGEIAHLTVTFTGSVPGGTTINWYDAPVGGNLIGTGNTLNLSGVTSTMTVYAGTCPGTYRVAALVVLNPFTYDAGSDLYLCGGQSGTLNATGGNSYSWTPSGFLSNAAIANPLVTAPSTTEFFVTVTDANGCTGVDSVMVYVNAINGQSSPDTAICQGATVHLQASGGTSYHWNTGDTTAMINLTPVTSQYYYVTVTSGTCTDTASTYVTVHPNPVVDLGPDTVLCQGASLNLDAGNVGSTYHWQDNAASQTIPVTTTGTYAVTVTNSGGCAATDNILVSFLTVADPSITPVAPLCSNADPVTLNAAQAGGTWSGSGITGPLTGTFDPATAGTGTFQVIYTITGACGDADTAAVTVNAAPVVMLGTDTNVCVGATLTLDAGNPGSTFDWQDHSSAQQFNVTISGNYSVTVTNANGCSSGDSIQVNVLPLANAAITPVSAVCSNGGTITLNAADPGGVWSGSGIINPSAGLFDPLNAGTGPAQVIYSLAGSCGDSDTISILVNPAPSVVLGQDTTLCEGITLQLDAGNPGSTYVWQDSSSQQLYQVNSAGTYSVAVTSVNGCSEADTIAVNYLLNADATITPVAPVCANAPVVTLTAAQAGGIWAGNGITDSNLGLFDPSVAGAGDVTVSYAISGLCGDTVQIIITVNSTPLLVIESGYEPCTDSSAGWINLTVNNGNQPYQYLWSNGAVTEDLTGLSAGNYMVTVTDNKGCQGISSTTIAEPLVDCFTPHIYIPNVFSPDGDGTNDVFIVRGAGIKIFDLIIYDRWGEKVFASTDAAQGWDGTFRAQDCETGVYYYRLKATLSDGQEIDKGGNITLFR